MFNKSIVIDNFNIQNYSKPYLIAEISGNHDNEIDRAKKLILAAKENGFDAVKIQYFTANDMTLDISEGDFIVKSGFLREMLFRSSLKGCPLILLVRQPKLCAKPDCCQELAIFI